MDNSEQFQVLGQHTNKESISRYSSFLDQLLVSPGFGFESKTAVNSLHGTLTPSKAHQKLNI